jgi:hypothetical protein
MQEPPRIIFTSRNKEMMFSSQFHSLVGGGLLVRPSYIGRALRIRFNFVTKSEQGRHCFLTFQTSELIVGGIRRTEE